jgi:hypothetical protein
MIGLISVIAGSVSIPSAAYADRKCVITELGEIRCIIVAEPAPDTAVRLGNTDLVWRRIAWRVDDDLLRGIGCVRVVAGVTEIGAAYFVILENTATNERLLTETVCTFPGEPPPTPPPPPPTFGEFKDAAANALTLQTSLNPKVEFGGITGLDTWLWCQDPGTQAVTLTLRGWTAVAEVDTVGFAWQFSGVDSIEISSSNCGSESAPAGVWQPQMKGEWAVALETTWAGTWALSYLGVPTGVFPLGPVALTSAAIEYPVDEFVGVLVDGVPESDG